MKGTIIKDTDLSNKSNKTIRLNINDNRVKKITQKSILVDIKSIEKISRIESNEDKELFM